MGTDVCFLVTVLYGDRILKCAIKLNKGNYPNSDWYEYPMEPDSRERLHSLLPLHVRSCGPIVNVEPLFEVEIVK